MTPMDSAGLHDGWTVVVFDEDTGQPVRAHFFERLTDAEAFAASDTGEPIPTYLKGCEACRQIGPALTAPGTSGRNWVCECGAVWHGTSEPTRLDR